VVVILEMYKTRCNCKTFFCGKKEAKTIKCRRRQPSTNNLLSKDIIDEQIKNPMAFASSHA